MLPLHIISLFTLPQYKPWQYWEGEHQLVSSTLHQEILLLTGKGNKSFVGKKQKITLNKPSMTLQVINRALAIILFLWLLLKKHFPLLNNLKNSNKLTIVETTIKQIFNMVEPQLWAAIIGKDFVLFLGKQHKWVHSWSACMFTDATQGAHKKN